jgi:lysophospholipase
MTTATTIPPRRYSYSDPRPSYRGACVPREQIKYRLQDAAGTISVTGDPRRDRNLHRPPPSGRAFELTVDRCSGEIVNVRRLDGPQGPTPTVVPPAPVGSLLTVLRLLRLPRGPGAMRGLFISGRPRLSRRGAGCYDIVYPERGGTTAAMDLIALAKNPVPSGATTGISIARQDQAALRALGGDARAQRGTVCLFQGRGEFIEKYFEVVADLRRRGFGVATMDWRGQGGSSRMLSNPNKGYVRSFADFDQDLAYFMKDVVLPNCAPPYIAVAHSMGGHILLRNASQPKSWFSRMVLSAPMIAIDQTRLGAPPGVARTYAEILSAFGFGSTYVRNGSDRPIELGPFEGNLLTSDRDRYLRNQQVLVEAPQLGLGSPTLPGCGRPTVRWRGSGRPTIRTAWRCPC